MKKLVYISLCGALVSTALAAGAPPGPPTAPPREETLFGPGDFHVGGFGGPVLKAAEIQGDLALLIGGCGGVILGHALIFGAGG